MAKANPKVFFDITADGKPAGRLVMELYAHTTPRTAENFRALCTGEKGIGRWGGKPLHYKGTIMHSLIPNSYLYGGDITHGNGQGGESIYEYRFFDDENFDNKPTGRGTLLMYNCNPDTNGSQFAISLYNTVRYEENVVFGKVIQGLDDVLNNIEKYAPVVHDLFTKPVVIANCGEIMCLELHHNNKKRDYHLHDQRFQMVNMKRKKNEEETPLISKDHRFGLGSLAERDRATSSTSYVHCLEEIERLNRIINEERLARQAERETYEKESRETRQKLTKIMGIMMRCFPYEFKDFPTLQWPR